MKTTKLKKRHRNSVWRDGEGDLWFWDAYTQQWRVLMADLDGGYHTSGEFHPKYYRDFKRVATSRFGPDEDF